MIFDDYKFHPSSLGLIMTDSRTKEPIGETAKQHLVECFVKEIYKREKEIDNKYIEKGNQVEEDSITLYSRVTKRFHKKNKSQIENDYFVGTPDLYEGEDIYHATEIKDIKSSWDIFTFFGIVPKGTNKHYIWQLQAYMDLTGAQTSGLVYCLVNTPRPLIEDQKRKLSWKFGIDYEINEEYKKACEQIEKLSVYDDIPIEKRYIEITVNRDQELIDKAHERVKQCRELMNSWT